MLTDLFIKNVAIIHSLHVAFLPGLTVLTGETGAGKSIIIDAVNLVLGERASTDLIRTGADEASVEAVFDLADSLGIQAALADMGIECDGELLVKRTLSRAGKNRVFINGGPATLGVLTEVTRQLVNIYGQHESQTLLKTDNHLDLLDDFAGLSDHVAAYRRHYDEYQDALVALRQLEEGEREAARRLDLLSFQSDEIGRAALQLGEEEALEQERQLLVHAERLLNASQGGYDLLYGGEGALLGQVRRVLQAIGDLRGIDGSLAPVVASLENGYADLEDAALSLRDYAGRIEADPERLAYIDDRLDLLGRLQKKYGATVADILAYKDEIDRELTLLIDREGSLAAVQSRRDTAAVALRERGDELTAHRRSAAAALATAMTRELGQLAMPNARFSVQLVTVAEPRPTGWDRAEFMFAPNPGEAEKPLARIASGGELSRLMLALKQVHPQSDVPTLIFDEVDSGISGATSALVGQKLQRVARGQQVLCITHLPQVAACGDHHLRVEKQVSDGRTITGVVSLAGEERVQELARMLGGVTITDTTMAHARELVDQARLR
jgi:DNA repair protein RecN (Recombination protein N)